MQSLQESRWFKLICGASLQHLPAVRSLTLAYGLAGADCIDVAADPVVVAAARDGIRALRALRHGFNLSPSSPSPLDGIHVLPNVADAMSLSDPWLMVSLNDGDDPHFRKATFDPNTCPADCDRPCETICPTHAIVFANGSPAPAVARQATQPQVSGVVRDRCYGCGRCVQVCPVQQIDTESYTVPVGAIAAELFPLVDAVEIHTQIGRTTAFAALWHQLRPYLPSLKLIAVSCPGGEGFVDYLRSLYDIMTDSGHQLLPCPNLWQTDGRPMSGDIGKGTTHAAIALAQVAIAAQLPGFIQLAGGTNDYTVPRLQTLGLLPHPTLAGVAYGSYGRKILTPVLDTLEQQYSPSTPLEVDPDLLQAAVIAAHGLVSQIKFSSLSPLFDEPLRTSGPGPLSTLNPV
ncbi:MAG: LdpA C-terminal domain-containing domain [Leptolyngbyaceae bacterium]|nr:LdpA C-terminal domain-containing domain [Leptolyngbyaceae bacterium]